MSPAKQPKPPPANKKSGSLPTPDFLGEPAGARTSAREADPHRRVADVTRKATEAPLQTKSPAAFRRRTFLVNPLGSEYISLNP